MDYQEAHKKFRSIEDDLNLFDARIGDFAFWDYLRYPIWDQILAGCGLMDSVIGNGECRSFHQRVVGKLRTIKNALINSPVTAPKSEFVFIGGGARRRVLGSDGRFEDVWCDPLIDHLGGARCQFWETSNAGNHDASYYQKRLSSLDLFERVASFSRIESKLGFLLSDSERTMLVAVEARILEEFGLELDLQAQVESSLLRRKWALPLITFCLSRINPKAVFIVCSYFGREIYVEACRKLRIPIIEIQHGTTSDYHLAYSYPEGASKETFPDYFLNFGVFWDKAVHLPISPARIFTLGYPAIESKLGMVSEKKKQVVFVSQKTISGNLWGFAVKLLEKLPPDWRIIYKLHPAESYDLMKPYCDERSARIEVVGVDGRSLHALLAESPIQIGVYSTAVYEGIAMGCRTYLLSLPGVEYMKYLIELNYCQLVSSVEEVEFEFDETVINTRREDFFSVDWGANFDRALGSMGIEP